MARKPSLTEEEIAAEAVAELQRMGYDTYEEVNLGRGGGPRPDIVGLQGPRIIIVEAKRSMSLTLLNQMMHWRGQVHHVIGAIGAGRIGLAADRLCRSEGLGLWRIEKPQYGDGLVLREDLHPRMFRPKTALWTLDNIRNSCNEHNRSGSEWASAGSKAGGYWTPFAQTRKTLLAMVKEKPGLKMEEYLGEFEHHYASVKSGKASLYDLIRRDILDEFELRREGRCLRVYPRDATMVKTEGEDS
jgi:hypothetical protein